MATTVFSSHALASVGSYAPPVARDDAPTALREVTKRDGRCVVWDPERITRAIALAFHASRHPDASTAHTGDAAARFGLGFSDFSEVLAITQLVVNTVERRAASQAPTVESIQDVLALYNNFTQVLENKCKSLIFFKLILTHIGY